MVSSSVPCLFFEKGEYDGKGLPFPLLQPREERGPPQWWTEEEEEVFFLLIFIDGSLFSLLILRRLLSKEGGGREETPAVTWRERPPMGMLMTSAERIEPSILPAGNPEKKKKYEYKIL